MIQKAYNRSVRFCSRQRLAGAVIAIVLLLMLHNAELPRDPSMQHLMDLLPQSHPFSSPLHHPLPQPLPPPVPVAVLDPSSDTNPQVNSSDLATDDDIPPPHSHNRPLNGLEVEEESRWGHPSEEQDSPPDFICDQVKAWDNIVIVVKTGATEAFDKIPTQFMTTLKCAKHVLIFSDMEQDVGPHHIYDALVDVPDNIKNDNRDFDLYRLQQEYKAAGQDIRKLNANKEMSSAAWVLDKYKNIHMAQKAFQLKPDGTWYFFIDADTYIMWPSLLRWLERLDPTKPLWLGTPALVGSVAFAHGGSGYILSHATMKGFLEKDVDVAKKFDESVRHDCCGDFSMAKALYDGDFRLTRTWPMTQGENIRTLPFGPARWCQPVITMHHVKPEEASEIWHYERARKNLSDPIVFEELFRTFLAPKIAEEIDDWDNQSESCLFKSPDMKPDDSAKNRWEMTEVERDAYKSFEHCGRACKADGGCFQWSYYDETCALDWTIKLGEKQLPGAKVKVKSGWDIEKIDKFRAQTPCSSPLWVEDLKPVGYRKNGTAYVETPFVQSS